MVVELVMEKMCQYVIYIALQYICSRAYMYKCKLFFLRRILTVEYMSMKFK